MSGGRIGLLLFVVILGTAGLSLLGTLLSAMTVQVRAREVMFPLLILPLVIPVLIGAVQATAGVMRAMDGPNTPTGSASWSRSTSYSPSRASGGFRSCWRTERTVNG